MEWTPEIGMGLIVYIVCTNWVYIREYRTKGNVFKRGNEWD